VASEEVPVGGGCSLLNIALNQRPAPVVCAAVSILRCHSHARGNAAFSLFTAVGFG